MQIRLCLTVALLLSVFAAACSAAPSSRDGRGRVGVGLGFSGGGGLDGTIGLPNIRSNKLCLAEKRSIPINHANFVRQTNEETNPFVFSAVYYGETLQLSVFERMENIA